jgi:hypothetical protein
MKKLLLLLFFMALAAANLSAQATQTDSSALNLKDYTGRYTFSETFKELIVEAEGADLYAEVDSYGKNKLLKQDAADTYKSTSSYGTVFIFKRNKDGKVVGVTLQLMGQELSGEKEQ